MGSYSRNDYISNVGLDNSVKSHNVDRVEPIMSAIGNPQDNYPIIHVGGTNGKGSTTNFIAQALQEEGYNIGVSSDLFVVPDFTHTIRFNDKFIPQQTMESISKELLKYCDKTPAPYELRVATALEYFSRKNVDIAVIEVGIGGEKDPTNIVQNNVSVITNVGLDHEQMLGDTVEKIARNIAGIINPKSTVVSGCSDETEKTITAVADHQGATMIPKRASLFPRRSGGVTYTVTYGGEDIQTKAIAPYEIENYRTAITAIESAPLSVSKESIQETIATYSLPGRMDIVSTDPLAVLDGGKNHSGISAISDTIIDANLNPVILATFRKEKDWSTMATQLEKLSSELVVTYPTPERYEKNPYVPVETVKDELDTDAVTAIQDVPEALQYVFSSQSQDIFATGSLLLLREIYESEYADLGPWKTSN